MKIKQTPDGFYVMKKEMDSNYILRWFVYVGPFKTHKEAAKYITVPDPAYT